LLRFREVTSVERLRSTLALALLGSVGCMPFKNIRLREEQRGDIISH